MPRYIDADALLERMEVRLKQLRTEYGDYDHYTNGFDEGLVAVEDADTADVVEVVRCKDCVWWEPYQSGSFVGRCESPRNGLIREYTTDEDFCSYGEKKKEAEI